MSSTNRRTFLRGAGLAGAAVVVAPEALASSLNPRAFASASGKFSEGVISGDPTTRGINLWTRLTDASGNVKVGLEVATDKDFRKLVARNKITAKSSSGHSVKAQVKGLKPYEQYYYRFFTDKKDSPVGRFRTALPADSNQKVRFAFFSCQDYTFGFYNAHAAMADDDLDFVVNLGDYIYAEAYNTTKGNGVRNDPIGESKNLKQYREKYALYRSDANLRKMHSKFPMISIWDDHEVQDNYAGGAGPDGGLAPEKAFSPQRQKEAYQAFFESMPTYPVPNGPGQRIYRSYRFGKHVELVMLDQRQYREDQPLGDKQTVDVSDPAIRAELEAPREMLGQQQLDFLKSTLKNSTATWKVISNEVMMMNTKLTANTDFNLDDWSGYKHQRDEILGFVRDNGIRDVISIVGDIHTFTAGGVRLNEDDPNPIITEFVGGSISSQGLGDGGLAGLGVGSPNDAKTPYPRTSEGIYKVLFGSNPWLVNGDVDHHGYGRVTADGKGLTCDLVRMETIKKKSTKKMPLNDPAGKFWNGVNGTFSWTVTPGTAGIK